MNGNSIKTFFLLLLMTVFFLIIGELIGGVRGMQIALIVAILVKLFTIYATRCIIESQN